LARLTPAAVAWAAEQLVGWGVWAPVRGDQGRARPLAPESPLAPLSAYLSVAAGHNVCACGCGTPLGQGRGRRYVSDAHRKRAARAAPGRPAEGRPKTTKEKT